MEIDPRFKAARANAARRRTRSWLRPLLIWGGLGCGVLALGLGLFLSGVLTFSPPGSSPDDHAGDGLTETDASAEENAAIYASPFLDVPGDPMVLRFDRNASAANTRSLIRPPDLPADRAGPELALVRDEMITREERLITTLPSSREDFAFFQAQREAPRQQTTPNPVLAQTGQTAEASDVVTVEEDGGSWGESLDGSTDATPVTYTRTRIENTTSLTYVMPENQRREAYADTFLRLKDNRDLTTLMTENGIDPGAARRFADQAATLLPETAALVPGYILALRGADRGGIRMPVQLSLYTHDSYIGSLAYDTTTGSVVLGADPWVEEDLFSFAGTETAATVDTSRKYRLLDAFYSAALRNGVPSSVVGETIVMLSQSFDLESFASPGDRMTLLYARTPGTEGPGPGQVLYAEIKGAGGTMACHVYRPVGKTEFSCFGAPGSSMGGGVRLREGMITPVKGVLTSGYGPRMHPILKVAKLHRGVDWAAPTGTPVSSAFDGEVIDASVSTSYGNVVRIRHAGGIETRYAHLDQFGDLARAGQKVRAGDVIGFVGTTGQSTGPHLHFELFEAGESVDPFSSGGGVMAGGSSAVEQLTDQIIRVESGGNADAKNPLSSATGLGQFIEGTWIRMMNTYRPDLANTMARADLLALRFDPTISREMVQNLAREGEAYLRARGHEITAGRLYLCHFLGAEGAHVVLSSADTALVSEVLGDGVVGANPFLKGRNVAYIKDWAEAKMNRKGGAAVAARPVVPPEVQAYERVIAQLLDQA
jgi:hypothetical protein